MDKMNATQTRARIREIALAYRGRLQPGVRQNLVHQGVTATSTFRREAVNRVWVTLPRFAAVATAAGVLALLTAVSLYEPKSSPVNNLQAHARNGQVILTWQDGDRPHEVVRLTSRELLRQADAQPGEMVKGETWVDHSIDDSPIVFYVVN